jgi:hypothetical protein
MNRFLPGEGISLAANERNYTALKRSAFAEGRCDLLLAPVNLPRRALSSDV